MISRKANVTAGQSGLQIRRKDSTSFPNLQRFCLLNDVEPINPIRDDARKF